MPKLKKRRNATNDTLRTSVASEPRERSAPAKRRARERVGESEGRRPSDELEDHIAAIDEAVGDATKGLPQPVFDLLCRLTPMVNVDLLIRNDAGQTLLTWRDDDNYLGWHVPGGIVRYKEQMPDRVAAVAKAELGAAVRIVRPDPVAITPIIRSVPRARGHFISFLFECELLGPPDESLGFDGGELRHGQWAWHASYPETMIDSHAMYRRFIDRQS